MYKTKVRGSKEGCKDTHENNNCPREKDLKINIFLLQFKFKGRKIRRQAKGLSNDCTNE